MSDPLLRFNEPEALDMVNEWIVAVAPSKLTVLLSTTSLVAPGTCPVLQLAALFHSPPLAPMKSNT